MAYKSAADGITKQGKTKGKNLGDSGPTVATQTGPIKGTVGKTNADMKKMGDGMANVSPQKKRK